MNVNVELTTLTPEQLHKVLDWLEACPLKGEAKITVTVGCITLKPKT
ncbi:hypothetical protein ES703_02150 [subsurface metagenome]